jgi:hypothetical protein
MRRRTPKTIKLNQSDDREIERLLSDGRTEQRVARRGHVLLAMKNSKTLVSDLCQQVGMTRIGIWYLCRRYESVGLNAIYDAPRSGRPREITALERVSIEQLACCEPAGVGLEMTHWSTRSLAKIPWNEAWCLTLLTQPYHSSYVMRTCNLIAVGIGLRRH